MPFTRSSVSHCGFGPGVQFLSGRRTRSVAQQLSKISSTLKKMETQEQSSLLKNAWNGEPSAVFSTKTLVSAPLLFEVGETSEPSGSRKQFLGHSHSSSVTVSWISLIARTTSQTQPLCLI